jgi:pilus assembly protein CpaB
MQRRLLIVLAFASVVGLFVSFMVYRIVAEARAAAARQQATQEILVASVNMDLAETVTPQHVKLVPWPQQTVPAGALRTLAEAEGRVVRSSMVAGEPILEAKLAPQLAGRGGIMPMLVPEGERGVTIKVDDAVKESGFVLPNSRVDVFVSITKSENSQDRVGKLILQDVLVLAAGQTVEMRDNKPTSVTTVTLSLTPEQAERLALAQTDGRLTLGTRNLRDKGVVQTAGVTKQTLLGVPPKSAAPPSAPKMASEPLPVPRVESHTVSVLRSTRVTEQVFIRSADQLWNEQREDKK